MAQVKVYSTWDGEEELVGAGEDYAAATGSLPPSNHDFKIVEHDPDTGRISAPRTISTAVLPKPWASGDVGGAVTNSDLIDHDRWRNYNISDRRGRAENPWFGLDFREWVLIPQSIKDNWSRSSQAYYWDSSGVLQSVPAGTPRLTYGYPEDSWVPLGLLAEPARTNHIDHRSVGSGSWATNGTSRTTGQTDVEDGTNAVQISGSDGQYYEYTHSFSSDNGDGWTASIYLEKDSDESRFPLVEIALTGGTETTARALINTKTGDVEGDKSIGVEDRGDWWRLVVTQNNNGTGNTSARVRVYPAYTSVFDADNVYSASGSVIVDVPQLERHGAVAETPLGDPAATFATSPIPTSGSAASRASDSITLPVSWGTRLLAGGGGRIYHRTTPTGSSTSESFVGLHDGTIDSSEGLVKYDGQVPGDKDGQWKSFTLPKTGDTISQLTIDADRNDNGRGSTFILHKLFAWARPLESASTSDLQDNLVLKPDHKWDLRQQAPNLLTDPESFDPASTSWDIAGSAGDLSYDGIITNIGPNGEDAHKFTSSGSNGDWLRGEYTSSTSTHYGALYVRAVTGTLLVGYAKGFSKTETIDTQWTWVGNADNDGNVPFKPLEDGSFYILRAQLNRGTSRAPFTTSQDEPQVIPDVIAGADLENGSSASADTNDLSQSTEGLVSNGDDRTEKVPSSVVGNNSWFFRVYNPAISGNSGGDIVGKQDDRFELETRFDDSIGLKRFRLNWRDSDDNRIDLDNGGSHVNEGGWNTVVISIEENDLRLNVNGVVKRHGSAPDLPQNPFRLVKSNQSGVVVSLAEVHPVLTEAEAEAVRQRLAGDPVDPVPPTERWDATYTTNPHNYCSDSESLDVGSWDKYNGTGTVTEDAADTPPNVGVANSWILEDTDGSGRFRLQGDSNLNMEPPGWVTAKVYVKKKASGSNNGALGNNQNSGPRPRIHFDPVTGEYALNSDLSTYGYGGVVDYSPNWWLVWMTVEIVGANTDRFDLAPAQNAADPVDGSVDVSITGSIKFSAPHLVRGKEAISERYVTGLEYPQTLPALRTSTNDLTLGDTTSQDTTDPEWLASTGVMQRGDDTIYLPDNVGGIDESYQATWACAVRVPSGGSAKFLGHRYIKNGYGVQINPDNDRLRLRLRGENDSDFKGIRPTINANQLYVFTLRLFGSQGRGILDMDGNTIDFSIDAPPWKNNVSSRIFSTDSLVGTTVEGIAFFNRILSDDEAYYVRQRILNSPDSTPPLSESTDLVLPDPTIDSTTTDGDTLTVNHS